MLGLGTAVNRGGFVGGAAPAARLLDTFSGAAASYSLRLLSNSYSGSAVQIRRSSDNVEVDVSFDNNGVVSLDSAVTNVTEETTGSSTSILTRAVNLGEFVANASYTDADSLGSTDSATVQCWYDQSSNSNDATQDTAGSQPTIVSSGALVTDNGKPAFTSTGQTSLSFTQISDINSVFLVLRPTHFTHNYLSFILGDSSNYDYHSGGSGKWMNAAYADPVVRDGDNYLNGTSVNLTTLNRSAGQYVLSMIHTANTAVASRISADRNISGRSWVGNLQELIIYSDGKTDQRTDIETNINTFYDIF